MNTRPQTNAGRVSTAFRARFGHPPALLVRAPGRINLIGAHVDYHEGWVMPGAIDRAVWLAVDRNREQRLNVQALDLGREASLPLDRLPPPATARSPGWTDWSDYPAGVAWVLRQRGLRPTGIDATLGGDLPMGAGVSSSAAVEVAFLLAWNRLSDLGLGALDLARLGRAVENRYVGIGSGIMDQFASLHGQRDRLLLLDCRDLSHQLLPLPPQLRVLIADSGLRRTLAGSSYNDRQRECAEALRLLRRRLPGLSTLRDLTVRDLEARASTLPPALARRARHVVEECARVRLCAEALRRGALERVAELIRASHESSRDLYQVSTPELDALAETAWGEPGCYGARLAGGGFGGCVIVLVTEAAAARVAWTLQDRFAADFGHQPAVFSCAIADGAQCL